MPKAPLVPRPLYQIAEEIAGLWLDERQDFYPARPYLVAMGSLAAMTDSYGHDNAVSVVLYFLSNAKTWRGQDARRIKRELRGMVEEHNRSKRLHGRLGTHR